MILAVGRAGPPRVAVVAHVPGARVVHVGADRAHLLGIEPPAQVQEAGFGEEVRDLGVVVLGAERSVEVERCAVAIAEVDVAAGVHRAGVDERAQHDPPIEEVAEVAARHLEPATGEQGHRCLQVVDDVGDVFVGEPHDCGAVVIGAHDDAVAFDAECPRARRRDDGERRDTELARTGHDVLLRASQ